MHPVAKVLQHIHVGSVSEGAPECDGQVREERYLHDGIAGGLLRFGVGTIPLEPIGWYAVHSKKLLS
jgi:hypothetical protein